MKKLGLGGVVCLVLVCGVQAAEVHTIDFAFGNTAGTMLYADGATLQIPAGNFDLGIYMKTTSGTFSLGAMEVLAGWSKTGTRGSGASKTGTEITNRLSAGFTNIATNGWNAPTANNMGGGKGADKSMGSYGSHLTMGRTVADGNLILTDSWYKIGELQLTNNMTTVGSQYTMKLWRASAPGTQGWSTYVNATDTNNELNPTTLIIQTAPEPVSIVLLALGGGLGLLRRRLS
jgi:hypothetical protein